MDRTFLELMSSGLPLNRKERFYTGTVLPMIICRNTFRDFGRFCSLLPGCPPLDIDGDPRGYVQFFSEYNLVDSLVQSARVRFPNAPTGRQAPDIVALVDGKRRV